MRDLAISPLLPKSALPYYLEPANNAPPSSCEDSVAAITLETLLKKLNPSSLRALLAAGGLAQSRTHHEIEVEHWLVKLLETPDNDLRQILDHYGIEPAQLGLQLNRVLDGLKTGSGRTPGFSEDVQDLMREAWNLTSLEYDASRVRSGYLLAALLSNRRLSASLRSSCPELAKIDGERLLKELPRIIDGSSEDAESVGRPTGADGAQAPKIGSKTPALDQFTQNLTERAKKGEIDPVLCRDTEIKQVIDILTRRRQNNPILTGEAGVGKTAVVEGFALRVAAGDVPPPLKKVSVRTLDLGLLQAGAGVKGEFENRLKSVIKEVQDSPESIILFIDEAHTIIGAGGAAGQGDAANLLKPALARGELKTIAATTWKEYKKFFEKDAALKRRFQVVKVDEPTPDDAIRMMRGISGHLEKHHGVRILDEAVADAVRLSDRYLADRQLPDKSVSVLDTACARVALGHSATPAVIEDCRREIEHLTTETGVLEREHTVGSDHQKRLGELVEQKSAAESRLKELEERWNQERELVEKIHKARARLEAHAAAATNGNSSAKVASPAAAGKGAAAPERLSSEEEAKCRAEHVELQKELAKLQGETPLIHPVVDRQAVAEVISNWTGVPVGKMVVQEIRTVLDLKSKLEERIIGQSHALEAIARRVHTARAKVVDPSRPIGVFMLVGPSGVGKTETALALADILYGGDQKLVIINMSEYQEAHTVSGLKGSPPGYVGFGEGGVLTEAVRRKPYCVVLLDEIEKAHPDVLNLFYQVFDKGILEDAEGQLVDFKNTIILLTSNVATDTIMKLCKDPDTRPDAEGLLQAIQPDLRGERDKKEGEARKSDFKGFKDAFLGRLNVVPYFPLGDEVVRRISRLQLGRIAERIRDQHQATFTYDDAVVDAIVARCTESESGARNIDHILTGTLLPDISREFLTRMAEGRGVERVHIGVDAEGKKFVYDIV